MKKILFIAIVFITISASAQRAYYFGDAYLSSMLIEQELLETPQAYNLWNEGNADIVTGSWIVYPSAAIFGWGIGTEIGPDYPGKQGGAVYIAVGGAGLIWGYNKLFGGIKKKKSAIALHHRSQKGVSFDMKPIANERGFGLAIKLD